MGAMLRALGIPSRLINGYGPGTAPNAASRRTTSENSWNVSSNDAHTWVEAYFPRYGWIPFEPTPPVPGGRLPAFRTGLARRRRAPGTGPTPAAEPDRGTDAAQRAGAGGLDAARSSGGRTVLIGVAGGWLAVVARGCAVRRLVPPPARTSAGCGGGSGIVGRLLGVPRDRSLTFDEYVVGSPRRCHGAGPAAWAGAPGRDGLREIALSATASSTRRPAQRAHRRRA